MQWGKKRQPSPRKMRKEGLPRVRRGWSKSPVVRNAQVSAAPIATRMSAPVSVAATNRGRTCAVLPPCRVGAAFVALEERTARVALMQVRAAESIKMASCQHMYVVRPNINTTRSFAPAPGSPCAWPALISIDHPLSLAWRSPIPGLGSQAGGKEQ